MNQIRIEVVIAIKNRIFTIYHSTGHCYQFSIIDEFECTYDYPEVFYTAEAAETEARKAVNTLSD